MVTVRPTLPLWRTCDGREEGSQNMYTVAKQSYLAHCSE